MGQFLETAFDEVLLGQPVDRGEEELLSMELKARRFDRTSALSEERPLAVRLGAKPTDDP
jgi:hypothetical protein